MSVNYEWVIEELADDHDDIVERYAYAPGELHNAIKWARENCTRWVLTLVRDQWRSDGQLTDRQYAYVQGNGSLPAEFEYGALIPKRFRHELNRNYPAMGDAE